MLPLIVAWVVLCASIFAASAQEPTGHTVVVVPDASAFNASGVRLLSSQQAVFMGDRLQTGPVGEAQLQFIDETRLVVGPSASLVIDSFVVKERSVQNFALSATRGTFRFFSGNSNKSAYSISTPTVTLGVRGTQFDFTVLPDGTTEFVLLHGEVRLCDKFGNCIVTGRPCTLVLAPRDGPIQLLPTFERKPRLEGSFPYVTSQETRLVPEFRTDVSRCGVYAQGPDTPIHIGFDDTYSGAGTAGASKAGGGFGMGSLDLSAFNILFPASLSSATSTPLQQGVLSVGGSRLGPAPVFRPRSPSDPIDPTDPVDPTDPTEPGRPSRPQEPPLSPTPLPGAAPMFAAAIAGAGLIGWLRKRAQRRAVAVA